jgi:hypothetical protein
MPDEGFDVDDWLAGYEPVTAEARLWPYGLVEEHMRLDEELAGHPGPDRSKELAEEIAALEERAVERVRVFTFRSLGALAWADLIAKHAPTPEQLKANPGAEHDESFIPAAMAAASVDPKLTVDQAERMHGTVSFAEWDTLWGAVLRANLGVLESFPKSALAVAIRRLSNGGSGTTAAPGASPAASSSGGGQATSEPPLSGKPSRTPAAPGAGNRATRRSQTSA